MKLQARKPETRDPQKKKPKTSGLRQLAAAAGVSATIALSGLLGSGCVNNQRNPTQTEVPTRTYTADELRFQRFFTGEPRAQVVGPGPYQVTMRIDVVTASGDRMSLEAFNGAIDEYNRTHEDQIPRLRTATRYLLYEEEFGTNGNIHRLRNPRFGIDDDAPEYLGIANVREGVVYRAELTPTPDGGENWVPLENSRGEFEVLFEIEDDLTPRGELFSELRNTDLDPRFRGNSQGFLLVPRNGRPCPRPVGAVIGDQ